MKYRVRNQYNNMYIKMTNGNVIDVLYTNNNSSYLRNDLERSSTITIICYKRPFTFSRGPVEGH